MEKWLYTKIQRCTKVSQYTSANTRIYMVVYTACALNENAEKSLEKVESILITTAKCCLKIITGKNS